MKDTGVHDAKRLKELQALPLNRKIQITQTRLIEWYQYWEGNVCISFSGGKDSTVLMHIARQMYPDIKAVFANTGLEYPEIQRHVKTFDNVDIVTPEINFKTVLMRYGYPLISKEVSRFIYYSRVIDGKGEKQWSRTHLLGTGQFKGKDSRYNCDEWGSIAGELPAMITHFCCSKTKKAPLEKYQRKAGVKPITATMAEESRIRQSAWIKTGCNAFESSYPISKPMSFWTEQDVLTYIVLNNVKLASCYGDIVSEDEEGFRYSPIDLLGNIRGGLKCTGCNRTGCIFCGFGAHHDKSRFERLAHTHPRQYEYCIGGGQWADNHHYDPAAPKYDGEWKNWNPKKIWMPSDKGLGMGKLFDMANEIMGKRMWRY